ncbi:MAG: SusD/RagB family nutrient-binding outer membrane lipoprotein [Prevotellaceae bacterium]|jgi:hypothetical protein|nr:SusD/RagB family nutrient-binding outer membrane lipoprotein [Prevotellaceae bacterium]
MKYKYILLTMVAAAFAFAFASCSEEDYSDKYADPSKVPTPSVDKLMTGVLYTGRDFVTPNYWRFFAFDNQDVGAIAQTWGMTTDAALYEGGFPPYIDEGWTKFQDVLSQFKLMEKYYLASSAAEQAKYKPYYLSAKTFMFQCLLQTLDCWGDIPYSESGQLPLTGKVVYPKKDDAKALYKMILDDLKTINGDFKTIIDSKMSISAESDYINDGNMGKWRKYANSIRLRAAIRLSIHGPSELTAQAVNAIKEIFNNPTDYPVVTGADDMIKVVNRRAGDFNWSRMEGSGDWRTCRLASKAMVDALDNDPRLPLIYDKVLGGGNEGKYVGVNTRDQSAAVSVAINGDNFGGTCQYSYVNETSFRENKNIEGYVVTPSEIAFYKAEAIVRGFVTGDEKAEFIRALRESVRLYANINDKSDAPSATLTRSPKVDMSRWTDETVKSWAEGKWGDTPANQLKAIYEQTWLHFGIINSLQSWNTIRRTGHPALHYPTVNSQKCPNVPQRFVVPQAEWTVNPNIEKENTPEAYYQKLFWANP